MKRKELLKVIIGVSLVAVLAIGIPMMSGCRPAPPEVAPPEEKVIIAKIGFLAPLTGPVAGWGLPGLYGDEIWVEYFNAEGGIVLSDGTRVLAEMVAYDNEYITEKALTGAKKLVLEDEVVLVQMLGGATAAAAVPFMTREMMLSTTLLPSDLTPDTLYHLAPIEVCPFYNVTHVEWLGEHLHEFRPDLTADGITFAQVAQDDELGRPGMAAMNAAAEAAGMEIVYWKLFDPETTDFAPIVSDMIASEADILCWGISYPDYVNLLTLQAYEQGFTGQLSSCTLDFYEAIIEKTSVEFMEDFIWQFVDLDDPMLNEPQPNPYAVMRNVDFWNEYQARYPGTWSAVSYEYSAQLDQWMMAVKAADSIDPMDVFREWKKPEENNIYHVFGRPATWWGKPFWGIDNAFMAPWPVTRMINGKSTIVEFRDQLDWWERNKEAMVRWNMDLDEMWWQRMGVDMESGIKLWGLEEEFAWLLEE